MADLELALRIRTDLERARREVEDLGQTIEGTGQSAERGRRGVDDYDSAVTKAGDDSRRSTSGVDSVRVAMDDAGDAGDRGGRGLDDFGDAAEDAGQQATKAGSGTDRLRQSATQMIADLRAYEDSMRRTSLSTQEMAEQEQRLDRLFGKGAISVKEYDEALERLDAQEAAVTKQHKAQERELNKALRTVDRTGVEMQKLDDAAEQLEQAWRDGRITLEQYNRSMQGIGRRRAELQAMSGTMGRMGLNTREARSQFITLGRSLATGNIESAAVDMLRLTQTADSSGRSFMRFIVPVGAVTAALAAFSAVSFAAWRDQRQLDNALTLTGNVAGLTEKSFSELARRVEETTEASIGQARDLAQRFVATGRLSREVVEEFSRSAATLQQLTGQNADEVVQQFAEMEQGVAEWVAKHNESMHFVTAEQYNYIRTLEEQGDKEAAMLAASEALQERYADEVSERIGRIERAWLAVRNAASEASRFTMNQFSDDPEALLNRRRSQLESRREIVQSGGGDPAEDPRVQAYEAEIRQLEHELSSARLEAELQADAAREETAAIAAQNRIRQLSIRADRERQMQSELNQLKRDFEAATAVDTDDADFSNENYRRLQEVIRERYEDDTDNKAAEAAENYVRSLERQAEAAGKTAAEVRLLTSREQELTNEQRSRVNGALILMQMEEERQQQMRDAQQLAGLEVQLLRAQGREAEAATMELEQQYGELLERLEERGDESGQAIIENLINLEELGRQLDSAEQEINQVLGDLARREQSIDVQREAGLISEYDARRQLLELHRETAQVLEDQRPLLEELSRQPGQVGQAASQALQALNSEMEELRATSSLLEETVRTGLEGGLSSALRGLADGTMNLRDAVGALGESVANALADMAAQGLAQSITGSLFGGGFGALFASTGGQVRGPGTGTSDSIPAMLSDKEYVTRAAVTEQPGALDFLHDFNKRGMAALDEWQGAARHNTGGLAGVPAPSMGPPSLGKATLSEPAKAFSAEVSNKFNFNLIDDPERISSAMRSRAGEEAISVMISRNPQKFRQLLKV